jgi:hypothetical protein
MNKTISFLSAGLLAISFLFTPRAAIADTGSGAPPSQQQLDQDIQLLRQNVKEKRRQVIAANLPLTTEESAKFWPLYDQYVAETAKISDARLERIKAYAANYPAMTDMQANEHVTKLFAADKEMIDLRMKYLPKFESVLPKKKAAMFVQMDRRLQMMIDLQIASQIPLINPK